MLRRLGIVLLKASITILVTLLIIEIGVRAIPLYPDSFEELDPDYGWRLPANKTGTYLNILCLGEYTTHLTINGQGLHDVEHAYDPTPGVYRVLVIGDSMVAGFEVPLEQTFYRRLETLLNARNDGRQYEVIGAGHRGYGTDVELLFYEHEAYRYQPDMVLLVFQPGNDVLDNHPDLRLQSVSSYPYFTLEDGELALHKPDTLRIPVNPAVPSLNPIHDALYQISYLYRLLYRRITTVQGIQKTFNETPDPQAKAQTDQAFAESWTVTGALLGRFRDEVEAAGGKFAVMIATYRSLVGEDGDQTYQYVYNMLDDLKIDYLPLKPIFEAQTQPRPLEYACDSHWTPAGHQVVAEQLANFLPPLMPTPTPP
jgi:hypothetical protein